MSTGPSRTKTKLLVIGYGSTLRSDDAVGVRVAEALDSLKLPGVEVLTCDLLTPELADPISKTSKVVFVDAAVNTQDDVDLRVLEPTNSSQILAHSADPRTLLALARDVFGHTPAAWWVTIGVENLTIGESLSSRAKRGIRAAVSEIRRLHD